MRAKSPDARAVILKPGLNVLFRPTEDDRGLLRSVFEALTGTMVSGLDAQLEVDGSAVALDSDFSTHHGLDGCPPPVVDVPAGNDQTTAGTAGDRHHGDPSDQRFAELTASERRLSSELELTRRELLEQRGRAAPDDSPPSARDAGSDLHPADVAVMCDRLRELLAMDRPAEALRIAERIEDLGRRRVYRIHREEALGQLIEECRAAERSAQEYLDSVVGPPRVPGPQGGPPDGEAGGGADRNSMEERLEAGTREAHTIARLDLLGELSDFWMGRLEELKAEVTTGNDLLADANTLLASAGELPSGSLRDAASRLREHARRSDYDAATVDELVEVIGGLSGIGPCRHGSRGPVGRGRAPAGPRWSGAATRRRAGSVVGRVMTVGSRSSSSPSTALSSSWMPFAPRWGHWNEAGRPPVRIRHLPEPPGTRIRSGHLEAP
ncbi:MAG: hypothetical protein M5U19_07860 [Microthrixaceae bacterium]|nr:hypothetical protein [Microthrixaceae bacterium]